MMHAGRNVAKCTWLTCDARGNGSAIVEACLVHHFPLVPLQLRTWIEAQKRSRTARGREWRSGGGMAGTRARTDGGGRAMGRGQGTRARAAAAELAAALQQWWLPATRCGNGGARAKGRRAIERLGLSA